MGRPLLPGLAAEESDRCVRRGLPVFEPRTANRGVWRTHVPPRRRARRRTRRTIPHTLWNLDAQRSRVRRLHARADDSLRRLLRAVEQFPGARRRRHRRRAAGVFRGQPRQAVGRRRGPAASRLRYGAPRPSLLSFGDCRRESLPRDAVPAGDFAKGRAVFTGVDVRWMYNGIQLRGEFLSGRPFDGTTTTGGYIDLLVHRVGMGPVTAVARLERLDYDTIP